MKSDFFERDINARLSRRTLLQAGAAAVGSALTPGMVGPVFAEEHPAIGTYPAGVIRLLGVHRDQRAAHRHLRGAGRRRTQGL